MNDPGTKQGANEDAEMAGAVRGLIRLCRTTRVGDPARTEALAHLTRAQELLATDQFDGPFWLTGRSAIEAFEPTIDLQKLGPFSPAMGPANPLSPDIEVTVDDEGTVHGTVRLSEPYNGPPFDTAHGGMVALLYDELIGMAAMLGAGGGMTANLSINYRRPTPLFKPLEITAWYERTEGRKLFAKGETRCDGELLSDAEGLFIRPKDFPNTEAYI